MPLAREQAPPAAAVPKQDGADHGDVDDEVGDGEESHYRAIHTILGVPTAGVHTAALRRILLQSRDGIVKKEGGHEGQRDNGDGRRGDVDGSGSALRALALGAVVLGPDVDEVCPGVDKHGARVGAKGLAIRDDGAKGLRHGEDGVAAKGDPEGAQRATAADEAFAPRWPRTSAAVSLTANEGCLHLRSARSASRRQMKVFRIETKPRGTSPCRCTGGVCANDWVCRTRNEL